jgi:hypothetical protein
MVEREIIPLKKLKSCGNCLFRIKHFVKIQVVAAFYTTVLDVFYMPVAVDARLI